jgi:hypothetical protein
LVRAAKSSGWPPVQQFSVWLLTGENPCKTGMSLRSEAEKSLKTYGRKAGMFGKTKQFCNRSAVMSEFL